MLQASGPAFAYGTVANIAGKQFKQTELIRSKLN
jgi:hypothetical protein